MKYAMTPAARRMAQQAGIDPVAVSPTGATGYIQLSDVLAAVQKTTNIPSRRATGLAKAIAAKKQIDIASVPGEGIVRKADVLAFIASSQRKQTIPVTGMRKVIARRMTESMAAPQYTLFAEFEVGALAAFLETFAAKMIAAGNDKPTYSDLFIKACALALTKHTILNSSFFEDRIEIHEHINIGLAVALADGLIVPNIKDADTLSLAQVTGERKRLVDRARVGKLLPQEYSGGTFTITNLGQFPIRFSTPIINQPESAILGIGAIEKKVVPIGDAIGVRPVLGLSLTLDHRHIDGAAGAAFLAELKRLLQNPQELEQ